MTASKNPPRADRAGGRREVSTLDVPFPDGLIGLSTGTEEMAIVEAVHQRIPRPQRITACIAAGFRKIDGKPATKSLARSLNAAAREWLLYKLADAYNPALDWFEAPCTACGKPFDLRVSLADAPRKDAAPDFPIAKIETSLGRRCFEAVNGYHEEAAARSPAGKDLRRVFAGLCGLHPSSLAEAELFDEHDLEAIEQALEDLAPDLADTAEVACPNCEALTGARIEPLAHVFPSPRSILAEVHLIASHYHWREREILELTPERRRIYASMIKSERMQSWGRR